MMIPIDAKQACATFNRRPHNKKEQFMRLVRPIALAVLMSASFALPGWAGMAAEDIKAGNAAFAAAFNNGDATAVAARYTEDGALLPPDGKRVDGRAAIEAFWKGAIDGGLKNLTLKTVEVDERGDLAYEVGDLSLDAPGEGGAMTTVRGKYVVVWKKDGDGMWRLHRDIWNTGAAQ
jgi:uncharacterized protein (TIGR02246 family)